MKQAWPHSTFLGRLPNNTLEGLMGLGTPMLYPTHRALLRQGDDSRHVLLLTRGIVKVVARSESGYEMLLAIRMAGDLVGEMSAFGGHPRSGTVIACSEVSARIIQMSALENFLARHPEAMRAALAMLCARLGWANRRRIESRAYDSPTRLARVLAELSLSYGQPVRGESGRREVLGVMINQAELASLAGLALPTAEKALASLSRLGLVERNYRQITVRDITQLLEFAKVTDENPY